MSMGFTGLRSVISWSAMCPPAESTAASMLLLWQAIISVYRPPEQNPMIPTLPLLCACDLRNTAAPSRSSMARASGLAKRVASTFSGSGVPSRVYRSGAMARKPRPANRTAMSLWWSIRPIPSMVTITAG